MIIRKPHNKTYKGMNNLKIIFEKRKNVFLGLTRNEMIALFYELSEDKVKKLKKETINSKWKELSTIKKYLLWKDNFAIIFKTMDKGTDLFDEVLGKRTLEKRTNVFFRCSDIRDAGSWRDHFDKVSRSIHKTASKPMEIVEEESESIKIVETIKQRV